MGIARWRLSNSRKSEDNRGLLSNSPKILDESDDMEKAYVHVRYQKSFDTEEQKLKQQQYLSMKQSRQQKLKPITSMGIK